MRSLGALLLASGCYTPHATTGAPCSPALDNCPAGQTCAVLGRMSVCVEGSPTADAPIVGDAPRDAPRVIDAPRDAAVPAWTLVQTASSTTPNVTVSPTGAGHLIIVAVQFQPGNGGGVQLVTDSAGGMYTAVPGSSASNAGANLAVQLWYLADSHAGAMSIAASSATFRGVAIWEVAGMRTTNPIDVAAIRNDGTSSTTPNGAPVTTTAAGDFIVSAAIVANNVTGTVAGNEFTNDALPNGNGFAHLTAPRAPTGLHQARWDQPMAGVYCSSTAAFFVAP
ncbi:MAG: hypothetical protein JO257_09990 [Deltaproteobacteria bacterium]|nr:hypothetical protein [Deltaproteobacteria bacterium]